MVYAQVPAIHFKWGHPVEYDRTTGRLPRLPLAFSFGIYQAQERIAGTYPQRPANVPPSSPLFGPQGMILDAPTLETIDALDVSVHKHKDKHFSSAPAPGDRQVPVIVEPAPNSLQVEADSDTTSSGSEDEFRDPITGQRLKTTRGLHRPTGGAKRYPVDLSKGQLSNSGVWVNFNKFNLVSIPPADFEALPASPTPSGRQESKPFPTRATPQSPIRVTDRSQLRRGQL